MAVNQLKAGALLNYAIIALNTLVGLLYTPYLLRMLGQSEYGLYSLVASVIAYLTVLDLGFGNAIIRYTAKYRAEGKIREQHELFGMFFILYFAIGVIVLIAGSFLYFNIDNLFGKTMSPAEIGQARIMMVILVFNLAISFPMGIFSCIITAYERFIFPKIINIARILLNTLVMVLLLSMGYKAIAMVVIQTIFNVLTLIINYIYCKRELRIKLIFGRFHWSQLKEISIYSFWIFLNVIMDRVYWSTGQFILGAVSGTIAIAVFALAIQLQGMYMQFSTAISGVFLPKVTGMVALKNNSDEISDLFIRTGRIQNIIMFFILSAFIVFGRPFIILWAGADYAESYLITLIFFIALYIPLIQTIGITILQARNQMKFRSLLYIAIALVALVLQFYAAKAWGAIGCAAVIAGALLLGQGLILNIYYHRVQQLNIIKFWREIIKMNLCPILLTIAAVVFVGQMDILQWDKFLIAAAIFGAAYIALLFLFSMNASERKMMAAPVLNLIRK